MEKFLVPATVSICAKCSDLCSTEVKTKNGKNPGQKMAFVTIEDTTGSIDNVVAFPEAWEETKNLLVTGNLVLLGGEKGKDNSFILKNVWQI